MLAAACSVPPLLRYARRHGLCFEYRQEDLLQLLSLDNLTDRNLDLPELLKFLPPHVEPPPDGRLLLSQEASRLLVSVTTQPPKPERRELLSNPQKFRKLKSELPLLMTDHAKDVRSFLPKRNVGIEDIDFLTEDFEEENKEGLDWLTRICNHCSRQDDEIAHEKFKITRNTLQFLNRTLRDDWTQEDDRQLIKELSKVKQGSRPEPLYPPLMLEDEQLRPQVSLSPAVPVPFTSDPVTSISIGNNSPPQPMNQKSIQFEYRTNSNMRSIEYRFTHLMHEEGEVIDYETGYNTTSMVKEKETKPVNSDSIEPKLEIGTVSARSLLEHIAFRQPSLDTLDENYSISELPLPGTSSPLFEDEKTHQRLITSKSPRNICGAALPESVALLTKLETVISEVLYGVALPVDTDLLAENIEGPVYQLPLIKDIPNSSHMLCKTEKLSLLTVDNVDEDKLVLDCAHDTVDCMPDIDSDTKEQQTLGALVFEKDKSLCTAAECAAINIPKSEPADSSCNARKQENLVVPEKRKSLEDIVNKVKKRRNLPLHSRARFSTTESLSSFLSTRTDNQNSQHLNFPSEIIEAKSPASSIPDPDASIADKEAFILPAITSLRTIFFSNKHMQQCRYLLRFFEIWAGENLSIIYRDLEVPILLSPSHAITITSLQALTQRPLPGHGGGTNSAFHDQISMICRERPLELLNVLVSTSSLSSRDQTAMIEFAAFCDGISKTEDCKVLPIYIPAGKIEVESVVAQLIIQHASQSSDLVFLQDETIWERFLVQAGMNPFGAQMVLCSLEDRGQGKTWGVEAFMQMTQQEREDRFGDAMGRKMLRNLSTIIDGSRYCANF